MVSAVEPISLMLPLFPDHVAPLDRANGSGNGHHADGAPAPKRRRSRKAGAVAPPPPVQPQALAGPTALDPYDYSRHFLALASVRGLGVQALRALVLHFGDLRLAWDSDPAMVSGVFRIARVPAPEALAETLVERSAELLAEGEAQHHQLERRGIRVVGIHDRRFPQSLLNLPDTEQPLWLFVEGNPETLNGAPGVAIVGTRDASTAGIRTAGRVATLVVQSGLTMISGLAEGIDAAAHRAAARFGGRQVAVLGTGINVVFPEGTRDVRRQLLEQDGAVVTEYLPNDSYERSRFVQRNRIQAGLAHLVCPVESRLQSGTMHTVRYAEKFERVLFGARYGEPDRNNELLKYLSERDVPVYTLMARKDISAARAMFDKLAGPRWPIPPRPERSALFRDVLRALDEVSAYVELTPEDRQWLADRILGRAGE